MHNQLLLLLAAVLPLTSATPSPQPTTTQAPSITKIASCARTTHTVVAGSPGLRFDPDNITAAPGSIIEFHFLPLNHSIIQASFAGPCQPKDSASFFSGFFPVSKSPDDSAAQSAEVFQIEVRDDTPIWFYCGQGRHCQSGMVGVVNQKVETGNTLEVFREEAGMVEESAGVQGIVQGGWRGQNPNPLDRLSA